MGTGDIQATSDFLSPKGDETYQRIAEIRRKLETRSLPPFKTKELQEELRGLGERVNPKWGR